MPRLPQPRLSVPEATHLFHLLSDRSRLRLLQALAGRGELSVTGLAGATGRSRSSVSINLCLLRRAGVVASRRKGNWAYYRLDSPFMARLLRQVDAG